MSRFPDVISLEHLAQIANINPAVVDRDIADTEREIEQYEHVQAAEREIAKWHWSDSERRLADYKAEGRTSEIQNRRDFVDYLKRVKAARDEAATHASVEVTAR